MGRIEVVLLAGLLSGAAGGFLVHLLGGTPSTPLAPPAALQRDTGLDPQPATASGEPRLARAPSEGAVARIEAALARIEALLSAAPPGGTSNAAPSLLARIDQRLAQVEERLAATAGGGAAPEKSKRRVSLEQAARELALSAAEENELRAIYDETFEKACALLANENESAEDVRREIESASGDEARSGVVMFKYLPRFLGKLPDLMALEAERQTRVVQAVGAERAARLSDEFDIEEANPLGVGGNVNVRANARGE